MAEMGPPPRPNAVCVLISGGLDSAVLVHELTKQYAEVHPVYIRCGLFWETAERYWLGRFLRKLNIGEVMRPLKTLSMNLAEIYGNHWSLTGRNVPAYNSDDFEVYLPGRNIILLAKTAVFSVLNGISTIAMAPLRANPFPDGTPQFFQHIQEVLTEGMATPLSLSTPFRQLSKAEVINMGRALPLELTFSCVCPKGRLHCGECSKCAERIKAFREVGIEDRTIYKRVPDPVHHSG